MVHVRLAALRALGERVGVALGDGGVRGKELAGLPQDLPALIHVPPPELPRAEAEPSEPGLGALERLLKQVSAHALVALLCLQDRPRRERGAAVPEVAARHAELVPLPRRGDVPLALRQPGERHVDVGGRTGLVLRGGQSLDQELPRLCRVAVPLLEHRPRVVRGNQGLVRRDGGVEELPGALPVPARVPRLEAPPHLPHVRVLTLGRSTGILAHLLRQLDFVLPLQHLGEADIGPTVPRARCNDPPKELLALLVQRALPVLCPLAVAVPALLSGAVKPEVRVRAERTSAAAGGITARGCPGGREVGPRALRDSGGDQEGGRGPTVNKAGPRHSTMRRDGVNGVPSRARNPAPGAAP
mmetsp:Transcript_4256/g.12882  ORF Transcript_4256/g.12882 Transcript_4256/m.12882 type:complete len:357 (-) Transcript_4256:93-1163(-)